MTDCDRCGIPMVSHFGQFEHEICQNLLCLIDYICKDYQDCNHDFQQEGTRLYKCTDCGCTSTGLSV